MARGQVSPLAFSPRLAGSDHTDHKLISEEYILTTQRQVFYTAPNFLAPRFINMTACNVANFEVTMYMEHFDAEDNLWYAKVWNHPVQPGESVLYEGGDVALFALQPGDQITVYASDIDALHCTVTVEENHARLTG